MNPLRCISVVVSLMLATACAHGVTDSPTSPTPATPAVTLVKLTVTPPGGGSMLAGTSVRLTTSGPLPSSGLALGAFAQYSDGSGQFIEAAWTSSDPAVAVVRDGALVAIGRGNATLTATAEGKSASESFVVEPGIAGSWSGNYVVENCQAGSASMFEVICSAPQPGRQNNGILPIGTAAPMMMQIDKPGPDNELTATAQFGELRGTLAGTDRGSNFLTLLGSLTVNQTTVTLVHWDARVQRDAMDGYIAFEVRINGLPSFAAVNARLQNVTRR